MTAGADSLAALTRRAEEAEEALRAIRAGEVDALVVGAGQAARVFTLQGADYAHRLLLEAMSEGALTLAADGTILYANLRFADLVGAPHERVVGASLASFVHEPDRRRFAALLQQGQDKPCRADLALCGPQGTLVLCVISMSPITMHSAPSTWAVVVTDVTLERSRAQDDLAEQKDWFRGALASIGDAVMATDASGVVTFMNQEAAATTGWGTEGIGKPLHEVFAVVNGETRARGDDPLGQLLQASGVTALANDTLLIARDGKERPIDGSAAPIRDERGNVLGIILVFRDISARKQAHETLRQRSAAEIEYLLEKTQKILDNIPTGVLALSDAEVTVAANRVLRERMPPTALGAPLPQAFPEAPSATILRLRQLIERTRLSSKVQSLFGEFLDLFGQEERYNIHVVPLEPRFPDTRFLLVIEDLSEVRALEGQLLRAEKLATVGVLAAGIGHEIGTPLGVVRGRAEYVLGKLGPDHPQAPGMRVIIAQIDHVTGTMRQLLDFSRVKPAVLRSVAVPAAVGTVIELLRLETQRRRISTLNEVSDTLPDVAADPDQLQQVLVNLVMNACDACAPGGQVTIRGRLEDAPKLAGSRRVRIDVNDDGCGIPQESRNQVFDPFFTTKKRGAGTGLGLSVVAQIVRNHRGEIELVSEPGRGTCVTLLWPTSLSTPALEETHGDAGQA